MKKITIAIAIFTVMAMVSGSALAATTLTVGEAGKTYKAAAGATVDVPIVASSLAGIAVFAFTVTHGTLVVTAVTSGKGVVDTFSDLGYDSNDGLETGGTVKDTNYSSPLIFNNDTAGETKIAAAVPKALTSTASGFLCTVTFKVPTGAKETETFPVKIIPTSLDNKSAGYDPLTMTPAELIVPPVITDTDNYKALLSADDLTKAAPAGTVGVGSSFKDGDVNGDGEVDTSDAVMVLNYYVGNVDETALKGRADVTGEGDIDTSDAVSILNYYVGNIEKWPFETK